MKTIPRRHYGRRSTWSLGRGHRALNTPYGVHIARQEPGGYAALRDDRCWRNAAGLLINTSRGYVFIMFRNLRPKRVTS